MVRRWRGADNITVNKHKIGKSLVLLAIPLTLSVFTHLWNPIGFPAIHPDEGTYMRRAMHILAGLGPQEFATTQSNEITIYDHPYHGQIYLYDHPYFGQLYLAAILGLIGYPPPHSTSTDTDLIGFLYLIPRLLMGALAVIDTLQDSGVQVQQENSFSCSHTFCSHAYRMVA